MAVLGWAGEAGREVFTEREENILDSGSRRWAEVKWGTRRDVGLSGVGGCHFRFVSGLRGLTSPPFSCRWSIRLDRLVQSLSLPLLRTPSPLVSLGSRAAQTGLLSPHPVGFPWAHAHPCPESGTHTLSNSVDLGKFIPTLSQKCHNFMGSWRFRSSEEGMSSERKSDQSSQTARSAKLCVPDSHLACSACSTPSSRPL